MQVSAHAYVVKTSHGYLRMDDGGANYRVESTFTDMLIFAQMWPEKGPADMYAKKCRDLGIVTFARTQLISINQMP